MRTIQTTATVNADHTVTLKLPDDIPPGERKFVVVVEAAERRTRRPKKKLGWNDWPAHEGRVVDPNCTFSREELYGEDGR